MSSLQICIIFALIGQVFLSEKKMMCQGQCARKIPTMSCAEFCWVKQNGKYAYCRENMDCCCKSTRKDYV